MRDAITWFEIPSTDFERAVTFYQHVLGTPLYREAMDGIPHAMLPFDQNDGVGGAVVLDPKRQPNTGGVHVYLPCTDIDAALVRVQSGGGLVSTGKTSIGPMGWYAIMQDTEGNNVGLHQRP